MVRLEFPSETLVESMQCQDEQKGRTKSGLNRIHRLKSSGAFIQLCNHPSKNDLELPDYLSADYGREVSRDRREDINTFWMSWLDTNSSNFSDCDQRW